jgi:hypothetical protein
MFPIAGFFACQSLRIIGSQIQNKRIFSLARILINLRRCRLQLQNLKKLIFLNKNWPNDYRVGCKSPFNLLKVIGIDANLEEELE